MRGTEQLPKRQPVMDHDRVLQTTAARPQKSESSAPTFTENDACRRMQRLAQIGK